MSYFNTHIFCCTNTREPGSKRGSCGQKGAEELRNYMKAKAKEIGLESTRVNGAGCLDRCELGPCVVVYPQGQWYRCTNKQDMDDLLQSIKDNAPLQRLQLPS